MIARGSSEMIVQDLSSDQKESAQQQSNQNEKANSNYSESLEEEKKEVNVETIAEEEKAKIREQMLDDSALKRFLGQRCMPIITERSVECTEILIDEDDTNKVDNNQSQNNSQNNVYKVASQR